MLRERWNVSVGGGLGPMADRAFRIGHLGALNETMILGVLGAVEAAMAVVGIAAPARWGHRRHRSSRQDHLGLTVTRRALDAADGSPG